MRFHLLWASCIALGSAFSALAQETPEFDSPNSQPNGQFGSAVVSVGDWDHDGSDEVAIGAYAEDGFRGEGGVYVYDLAHNRLVNYFQSMCRCRGAFGVAMDGGSDVDGDGTMDLAVGAPEEFGGRVYVFSGATGETIRVIEGPNGAFGHSVAFIDVLVDGQRRTDLLVGAYKESGSSGRAYVVNGRSGEPRMVLQAPSPESSAAFGRILVRVPDLTGDGVDELAISAPFERAGGVASAGKVHLFDGMNGEWLRSLESPAPETRGRFGIVLASSDDLDGDGLSELVVGAAYEPNRLQDAGRVYVFNAATGALLYKLGSPNPTSSGRFGHALTSLRDVNGDGVPDIAVGALGDASGGILTGNAYVFSGVDGARIYHSLLPQGLSANDRFGHAVAAVRTSSAQSLVIGAYWASERAGKAYHVALPKQVAVAASPLERKQLRIVPNPAGVGQSFRASATGPIDLAVVYDIQGRVVAYVSPAGDGGMTLEFRADGWAPGTYLLRVLIDGEEVSQRFTVVG